jgi:hypothetical protein
MAVDPASRIRRPAALRSRIGPCPHRGERRGQARRARAAPFAKAFDRIRATALSAEDSLAKITELEEGHGSE